MISYGHDKNTVGLKKFIERVLEFLRTAAANVDSVPRVRVRGSVRVRTKVIGLGFEGRGCHTSASLLRQGRRYCDVQR